MGLYVRMVLTRAGLRELLGTQAAIKGLRIAHHGTIFVADCVGPEALDIAKRLEATPGTMAEFPEDSHE